MDNVLVAFSNPIDTTRIRLDKEHRSLQAVIEATSGALLQFDVRHATSKADLAHALSSKTFRIVHFSGHGSDDALFVEGEYEGSDNLTPIELRNLLQKLQPQLSLLILMSCYSASTSRSLIGSATYLISVRGAADDQAAISFTKHFYDALLKTNSIEKAFGVASFITENSLAALLTRRATSEEPSRELLAVYSKKRLEPMFMDLSEAEESITRLNISRETIVSTLGRKMHIHRWIFEEPRDRAVLTVGPYFGIFSWKSPSDIIVCHKILKIRADAPVELIQLWAKLIVTYNDLYMSEYRLLETAVTHGTAFKVERAITDFRSAQAQFFERLEDSALVGTNETSLFISIGATFSANVEKAAERLQTRDYARSVIFLETALSSVHDFIDSLVERLAESQ